MVEKAFISDLNKSQNDSVDLRPSLAVERLPANKLSIANQGDTPDSIDFTNDKLYTSSFGKMKGTSLSDNIRMFKEMDETAKIKGTTSAEPTSGSIQRTTGNETINSNGKETELPASSKSLWETACANPGKTALAIGGLVLTAGLMKAGLSRAALTRLPRVLVIEESPFMGQAIKATLNKSGYTTDVILGARSLKQFVGIAADGSDLAVDLGRYRFGVIAGGLQGKYSGMEIAQRLSSERMTTIGLSTSDKMSESFRLNGAGITTNKGTGFAALHHKIIDPVSAIRSPQRAQSALDSFEIELHKNRAMRQETDQVLMEAMTKYGI